jgi:hypothetical protein
MVNAEIEITTRRTILMLRDEAKQRLMRELDTAARYHVALFDLQQTIQLCERAADGRKLPRP